jgi:formate hydrogenlyase regulatory protein HycA
VIPIAREADYRTDTIGRYDLGQFFAWVTAAYLPGERVGSDWRERQRWYAVMHRFDHDGNHVSSEAWCPGPGTRDGVAERLQHWLDELPGRAYGDIAIRPFQVTFDGIVFGLVQECHGQYPEGQQEDNWAEFYPGRLGFHAPWDGEYDT